MKYCPACKTDKPETGFYAESRQSGGLSSYCKECKRARNKRYWQETYYPANRNRHIQNVLSRKRKTE